MPGIDPRFLCHRLVVCRDSRPVAQKKRKMGDEKRKAAEVEVQKLLRANFIREITYTTWLANIVLVKKANGKWRMCTNYTDLNKACPKNAYPLPCIDRLNVGVTYQRLMDKVFQRQIGSNIEIYVDDMVVKSNSMTKHIADLGEIFGELRKHKMRLNPEKCTFGVKGGKFLGFMLSARGIKAKQDKCKAVIDMRSPINLKELQRLSGSRLLQDPETRYQLIEKVTLDLVHTSRRLRHYFQSHKIVVHTDFLISKVLEADYVMREVHKGICGMHSGARTTVSKLLRVGYYWPTMNIDCLTFVKKCQPSGLGIQHKVTPVEHPQTNGQAESANKVILTELKKRLGEAKRA
uniref:Uncharacterized protein K02A2.6 n=1 Tax=Cajanus cajan TaxID=3821 RepID=A0A151U484_CAJCA|nr:Uncharacterized protein K02A2.6 [Cajanus cajan]